MSPKQASVQRFVVLSHASVLQSLSCAHVAPKAALPTCVDKHAVARSFVVTPRLDTRISVHASPDRHPAVLRQGCWQRDEQNEHVAKQRLLLQSVPVLQVSPGLPLAFVAPQVNV